MLFGKKEDRPALDMDNIPVHIAAVMDGNGRWAQKRGLPRTAGHSAGSEAFQNAAEYLQSLGVQYFTVYAFPPRTGSVRRRKSRPLWACWSGI